MPINPNISQIAPGQRPITPEQMSPALDVIQRLLTQPRTPPPGVITGATPSSNSSSAITGTFTASGPAANGGNGQFGGGGIAGVASKHEGRGIKIVNDRERIEEWEFIYDYAKDTGRGRPNANTQTQQPSQPGIPGLTNSGFGNNTNLPGFGGQGGGNNQGGRGRTRLN
jgi:hypothetical protein